MFTSEGRAPKTAKIVDNESLDGDSSDGIELVDSRLSDGQPGAQPIQPSVMARVNVEYFTGESINARVSTFESRTYVFIFSCFSSHCVRRRLQKIIISPKKVTYRERSRFIQYTVRAYELLLFFLLCSLGEKKKMTKKTSRGVENRD